MPYGATSPGKRHLQELLALTAGLLGKVVYYYEMPFQALRPGAEVFAPAGKPRLLDQVKQAIRTRHYSSGRKKHTCDGS